jgi:hypothetical protein
MNVLIVQQNGNQKKIASFNGGIVTRNSEVPLNWVLTTSSETPKGLPTQVKIVKNVLPNPFPEPTRPLPLPLFSNIICKNLSR